MASITYRNFVPTPFDKHVPQEQREGWVLAPVSRNRDTVSALEIANWEAQLLALGGESETVEIHRFAHWACGWFEILLVHPDRQDEVETLMKSLEEYPVLDEELLSEVEQDEAYDAFISYSEGDFLEALGYGWSGLPFSTWDLFLETSGYCSWTYEDSNEGVRLNIEEAADVLLRGNARHLLTAEIIKYCKASDS